MYNMGKMESKKGSDLIEQKVEWGVEDRKGCLIVILVKCSLEYPGIARIKLEKSTGFPRISHVQFVSGGRNYGEGGGVKMSRICKSMRSFVMITT